MNLTLPPRLQTIASLITAKKTAADVGTDHGYLPVYLVVEKRIQKVIATDVNQDPLDKARKLIQSYGLEEKIITRLGDGLRMLEPYEAESIIIAGMGGVLISDMLFASPEVAHSARELILQPMQAEPYLRRYLIHHGYFISQDILVHEKHHFYSILVARYENRSAGQMDPFTMETGLYLRRQHPSTAQAFLLRKIQIWQRKFEGLQRTHRIDKAMIEEASQMLQKLKEELEWHKK